jgi:hypothetical protein
MRELADEFDAVCSALAREGDEMVTRDRAASATHVGWALSELIRRPLRPPVGIPFMTWATVAEIDAWLLGASPPLEPAELDRRRTSMRIFRKMGFCFALTKWDGRDEKEGYQVHFTREHRTVYFVTELDPDGEYEPAFIAAPVFSPNGRVDFVLSLIAFARSFSGREIEAMGKRIRSACDRITDYMAQPPIDHEVT